MTTATATATDFDFSRITDVYSGMRNRCMCGCSGKYTFASAHVAYAAERRGYSVPASAVNDRVVRLIAKKILAAPDHVIEDDMMYADIGGRSYVARFKPEQKMSASEFDRRFYTLQTVRDLIFMAAEPRLKQLLAEVDALLAEPHCVPTLREWLCDFRRQLTAGARS